MKNKRVVGLILTGSIIALGLVGCSANKDKMASSVNTMNTEKVASTTSNNKGAGTMMNEGKIAPNFELKDINGNVQKLSDYKGKKVYLKFWASWCSICLAGLDEINTLSGEKNDFVVLTVVAPNYRGEKSSSDFAKWFKGLQKTNMNVLLDEDGKLSKELDVRGYPTSVFIGSDGILVKTLPGHESNDAVKDNFKNVK